MEQTAFKGKVLVIDDTISIIDMVKTALTENNYQVLVATSGTNGIKSALKAQPDLVLLDILMPEMDGYETCRELKKNDETEDIPVIFMSALSEVFDKVKAFNLGAVDYITKPLNVEELLARVGTQVSLHRMQRQLKDTNVWLEKEVEMRTHELRESHKKYQTVADFTYDWEYWILPDGSIEYMSASCERITGYTVDEFISNPRLIDEIIHSDDKSKWNEHLIHASEQVEHDVEFSFRINTKQNKKRWIGHVCKRVYDFNGNFNGTRVSNRDITAIKKAEEQILNKNYELQAAEEELRAANDALKENLDKLHEREQLLKESQKVGKVASWEYDFVKNKLTWSDEVFRMVGFKPGDFEPNIETYLDYIHPDDREKVNKAYQSSVENKTPYEVEHRFAQYGSKKLLFVKELGETIYDEKGNPVKSIGMTIDITEQKLNEQKLKEKNEELQAAEEELQATNDELKTSLLTISESENAMKLVVNQTMGKTGTEFFNQMVLALQQISKSVYTFIGIINNGNMVSTIAISQNGSLIDNFNYNLEGSPCDVAIKEETCVYTHSLCSVFPEDKLLADMGIEAYIGTTVKNSRGERVGIIASMYDHRIEEKPFVKAMFEMFASKIGAELERLESEANLLNKNHELQAAEEELKATNDQLRHNIEKLTENEYKLNAAQKLAKLGHYNLDFTTGIWSSSKELDSIFGIDNNYKRDVEGWLNFVHPDFKEMMLNYFTNEVIGKKQAFNKEYQIINQNNKKTYWVHGLGELSFDDHGNLISMIGSIQDITKRKIAEDELVKSEAFFSSTLNDLHVGVVVHASDTSIVLSNPRAQKILGLSKNQMLGKTAMDPTWKFVREDGSDMPLHDYPVNKVINSKKNLTNYILGITSKKKANITWVTVNAVPTFDSKNNLDKVIVNFMDISKRKMAENEMHKAIHELGVERDLLHSLMNNIPDTIYFKDVESKFTRVNKAQAKLLGIKTPAEAIGKTDFHFLTKEHAELALNDEKKIFSTGKPIIDRLESVQIQGKGHRYLSTTKVPLFNEAKEIIGLVGVTRDITEHKKIEIALKESEERFSLAMEASHDGLFDWNLITNEVYFSPTWKNMLGYKDKELPNEFSVWENLTDPEDVKKTWVMIKQLIDGKRDRFEIEFKMKHKKGHWVPILSRASAIFDKHGKAVRMVGTHVDLTDIRKIEQQLVASENLLKQSQAIAHVGSWAYTASTDQLTWSDETYRIFGFEPHKNKLTFDFFIKQVHPDDQELVSHAYNKSITNKDAEYQIEHRVINNSTKEIVYVVEKCKNIFNSKGEFVQSIGMVMDITEQKKSRMILDNFFNQPMNLHMVAKVDGTIEKVNTGWETTLGYKLNDFVGSKFLDYIHPDDLKDTLNEVKKLSEGITTFYFENRYKHKNGSYRTLAWSSIVDIEDSLIYASAIDITEKKEAEKNLEKTNAALQQIIQASSAISGQSYFNAMARALEDTSEATYSFIGECIDDKAVKTVSLSKDGTILKNITYELENTPCANVNDKETCFYPEHVTQLFPEDKLLVDMGIEAYVGTPIFNHKKQCLGIVVSLYDKPIENADFVKSIFEIFAGKIGAEMERLNAEKALIEKNEELQAAEEELMVSNDELRNNINLLHISEQKLTEAQSTAHIGHWEWDVNTGTLTWSDEIFNIFGANKMTFEVSAENFEKNIHPDDLDKFIEQRADGLKSKKEFSIQHRIVRPDGETRYVEERTKTKYKNNNLVLVFGTVQDITDVKLAELELIQKNKALQETLNKLQQSETSYNNIFNNTRDGYVINKGSGEILQANPAFAEMLGYSSKEISNVSWKDLTPEKWLEWELENHGKMLIERGYTDLYEKEYIRKDGTLFPIQIQAYLLNSPKNLNEALIGAFVRDITKQKLNEEKLISALKTAEENETRFKALHNASFGGIAIHDVGIILETNQGMTEITGYSYDELVGMNGLLLISEATRDMVLEKIKTQYNKPYEAEGLRKDGSTYPLRLEGRQIPYKGKEVRVVEFRDITEQKEAERKLKESEERYRSFIANSFEGVVRFEMEPPLDTGLSREEQIKQMYGHMMIAEANDSFAKMYGYKYGSDIINQPISYIWGGYKVAAPALGAFIDSNYYFENSETFEVDKDGNAHYFLNFGESQFVNNKLKTLWITQIDITEQKETERLILENEDRYRNLQEHMQSGVIVYKPINDRTDFKIIGFNKAGEQISGIPKNKAIGKSIKQLFPDIEQTQVFKNLQKVSRTGKTITMDADKAFSPNSKQYTSNQFYKLPNGEVVAIFDDVTEKILAEKRIKESEERFRTLAENTPGVIYLCYNDATYSMVYLNDQVKELTGYNKEDFYKAKINFTDLYYPGDRAMIRSEVDKAISEKKSFRLEYRLKNKKGEWRWIEEYGAGIFEGDKLQFIEGSLMDITGRKNAELIAQTRLRIADFAVNHNANQLLTYTLDEAEKLTESKIGFYHFVNEDNKNITLHAWSTNTIENMCTTEGIETHYAIDKAGVWVDCIQKRRTVVHNDYNSLTHKKGMPNGHAPVIREMVVPVFRNKKIVAVLGVGNKEINYTKSDINIVEQLADIAFETVLRKRAEEDILEQRNRTVSIIEGTNAGTWEWMANGNELIINERWAEIIGYRLNEINPTYDFWFNSIHPDDKEFVDKNVQAHLNAETEYYDVEFRQKHKNGSWVWINARGKINERNSKGEALRMTGTHLDITEKKITELAFKENEQQLQLIFDSSPAIMLLVNSDRKIVRMNKTGLEFLNTEISDIYGQETGKAFNCVVSIQDKLRCGQSYACKDCALKTTVDDIISLNKAQNKVETRLNIIHDGKIKAFTVLISTSVATVEPEVTYLITIDDISERKQTEIELRKSEERFMAFMNNTPVYAYIKDNNLNHIYSNKMVLDSFNIKETKKISSKDLFNTRTSKLIEKADRAVLNGEKPLHIIEYHTKIGKQDVWFRDIKFPIKMPDDKILLGGVAIDITESKRGELALKESETRFRTIIESANDAIFISDAISGNIIDVNRRGEDLMGISKELIIGMHLSELHQEDEREKAITALKSMKMGTKDSLIRDLNIQHISGILIPVEISPALIKLSDNKEYIVGFYRDVTKRKIAEDALIESESRFKLLVDVSIEGIILHKKGNIIDVNPAFCNITGYTEKELIGSNIYDLIIPETHHAFVEKQANKDIAGSYEITIQTKQGKNVPVAISSRFISKREKLRVASVRDISKEQEVQQQILQAIINTEEIERKRVAQELHDGLGPVLSTVKLYTETFLKSDNEAFKAKIKDQLLIGINEALQQVSTISNNLSPHVLDDFGLKAAIERFIEKLHNVATTSFSFEFKVEESVKKEVETTLYRVTTELINNSMKYAEASLIYISITNCNGMICLNYTDDGKGFNYEAIKDSKKGMGLFNIENRVKSLNGYVNFKRGEEKGINYMIEIPNN